VKKRYMIGNTHFDPVWLWRWDEAMASVRATFRSALERMKEDADFVYSFATPPVFEWIKNTDPEMFEEIKQRVKEGRWELAEAWWVQPDCYSACGESYVRQGLYGQKYLKDNFGLYSNCVFNIDCFGHSPALPQILKKSHIDYYCFMRPERHHIELETPCFWWKGIDGSEVLTYRAEDAHSKDLNKSMEECNEYVNIFQNYGIPEKRIVVLCPPYFALNNYVKLINNKSNCFVGAQNCSSEKNGSFAGEVSCEMIKSTGARYVIIGHSERRIKLGETDEIVNEKVKRAIESGLVPIICVGEKLDEISKKKSVLSKQLSISLKNIDISNIIIVQIVRN